MPNDAYRKYCIASDRNRKSKSPHQCEDLQNIMPGSNVRYMAKRTYLVVEDIVPDIKYSSIHSCTTIYLAVFALDQFLEPAKLPQEFCR